MTVTVLLFAGARVRAGVSTLTVDLPEPGEGAGAATVADLRRALAAACPALAPLLPSCRVAVAAAYADDLDPISPGAEVALIPPVSGGSIGSGL